MGTDRDLNGQTAIAEEGERPTPAEPHPAADSLTTFLFTDVEGSSQLWQRHPDGMRIALLHHDDLVGSVMRGNSGAIFKTIGDAFCAAFEDPADAIMAAVEIQSKLAREDWPEGMQLRVRAAIHLGYAERRDGDYFGSSLTIVNRLLGLAHGGQTLVSEPVRDVALARGRHYITFRDLGRHRLKGIDQADHVYQLNIEGLQLEFPPLRTIEHASTNLPQQLGEFIGRKKEAADIGRLLSLTRLLSLVGPGGIGKTRLALHVAHDEIENFADGVWLVQLDSIIEPGNVLRAIAAAIGVVQEPGRDLRDVIRECMRPKPMLLVLDNCEHVVDECGAVITDLLQFCPYLTVLATTQEALKIPGEVIWAVPTLSPPPTENVTVESLAQSDAANLFISRAKLASSSIVINDRSAKIVARICANLEGIPLAIELAAARVNALTLEQIAQRLDDRFRLLRGGNRNVRARHQALRATLDWSYDLLNAGERAILDRVSVFVGGWTLDAAEAVCDSDEIHNDVLDVLGRLVDKSMVIFDMDASRYRMLETIRQYAAEKLLDSGREDEIVAKHAAWYAGYVEATEQELWLEDQAVHLKLLETDIGNLRAALTYFQERNIYHDSMRIAAGLYRFWAIRGYMHEGLEWLTRSLIASPLDDRTTLRARALSAAGGLAWVQCDYGSAYRLFSESLGIRTELADKQGIADTLNNMGQLATDQGHFEDARELLEKSLALQREIKDGPGISSSLSNLALLAQLQRDYETSKRLYTECLAIDRKQGDHWSIANTLDGLARVTLVSGNLVAAREMLRESLMLRLQIADKPGLAEGLEAFARLSAESGDHHKAIVMWGAAESCREAIAVEISPCAAAEYLRTIDEVRNQVSPDQFELLWRQGRETTPERACLIALEEKP